MNRKILPIAAALALLAAAGCGGDSQRQVQNDEYGDWRGSAVRNKPQGSTAGLVIFGVDKEREQRQTAAAAGSALGVNAFLWRATLDTLAFMPLASADPFGGTIITDWYSPPATNGERFRAQAYVMGRQLRSDGVRVQVFKQTLRGNQWVDAPVSGGMNGELEDKILSRARELRSQSASR